MLETTACWFLRCRNPEGCPQPMLLPLETLRQQLLNPAQSSTDFGPVAVGCPKCTHLEMYLLDRRGLSAFSHLRFLLESGNQPALVSTIPDSDVHFVREVRCVDRNCASRLPVFGVWSVDTSFEERERICLQWAFDRLCCPNGHAIQMPVIW